MNIGQLLDALGKFDQAEVLQNAPINPHSYRGYYNHLSMEPTVSKMAIGKFVTNLNQCMGQTYIGWKGGEYTMNFDCELFVAYEGSCGVNVIGIVVNEHGIYLDTTEDY